MTEPEVLQAGKVRPRRAKRRLPRIPIPVLYLLAVVLALVWSIVAYWVLVPHVEKVAASHGVMWGFLIAFLVGFAGACGIVAGAHLLAQKIREA